MKIWHLKDLKVYLLIKNKMEAFLRVIWAMLFTGGMWFVGAFLFFIFYDINPIISIISVFLVFLFWIYVLKQIISPWTDEKYFNEENDFNEVDYIDSIPVDNISKIELHPNNSEMIIIDNKKIKQIIMSIIKEYDKHTFEPLELEKIYWKIVYWNTIKLSVKEYNILKIEFQKFVVEWWYVRIIKEQ